MSSFGEFGIEFESQFDKFDHNSVEKPAKFDEIRPNSNFNRTNVINKPIPVPINGTDPTMPRVTSPKKSPPLRCPPWRFCPRFSSVFITAEGSLVQFGGFGIKFESHCDKLAHNSVENEVKFDEIRPNSYFKSDKLG